MKNNFKWVQSKLRNKSKRYLLVPALLLTVLLNFSISIAATPSNLTDFGSADEYPATNVDAGEPEGYLVSNILNTGWDFRVYAASHADDVTVCIERLTGQTHLAYGATNGGLTQLNAISLASNDGKIFDLNSVEIIIDGIDGGAAHGNVRLVGYSKGAPVAGAILEQDVTIASSAGQVVNFDVSSNSNFIGIDMFKVQGDGTYTISGAIGVDNINAVNFRTVLLKAHTATASANTANPAVGVDDAITLTVKNSLGNTDSDFDGGKNLTLTGVEVAPDGSYGSFNGTALNANSVAVGQVISVNFTDGVATANLKLNKADSQAINFSIGTVTTPATNAVSVTPTHGTEATMTVSQNLTAPGINGGQFAQQPRITLKDAYGNICTSNSSTVVTVAKEDVGSWTLTGTLTATANSGIASFTNLGATNTALLNNAQLGFTSGAMTKVTSAAVTLPAPAPTIPSGSNSGSSSDNGNITTPTITRPNQEAVIVIVNGIQQDAGKETKTTEGGKSTVTVEVNNNVIEAKIDEAVKNNKTGTSNTIQVPVADTTSEVVKVELNGDLIKKLETNTFDISVKRGNVEYILPSQELNVSQMAQSLGISNSNLKEIKFDVQITKLDNLTVAKYNEVAKSNGAELVFPPMQFEVSARTVRQDGTTTQLEISKFSNYVERVMEIPANVDPSKITTGIVFNADGSYSHVPTEIFKREGKWFAKLNSLTNSNYSVAWNPITVKAVEKNWSKDAVNDMASRMVVFNFDTFDPNKAITRADFAEYMVRALGLYRTGSVHENHFKDVSANGDRTLAILIANEYGIISGYPDGTFRPNQVITREEAMVMYQKAMKITKLVGTAQDRYASYADYNQVGTWASTYVKEVLSAQVFSGTSDHKISPKDNLTYAEAAQAIKNLLVASKLINQ